MPTEIRLRDTPAGHRAGPQRSRSVTDKIAAIVLTRSHRRSAGSFGFARRPDAAGACCAMALTWLLARASASGASTSRSAWGFDIINFVWWIGIGHAGTLISAILLLLRQDWRTSINRFAEAMTLFAVACAAMFPLLHTGRPWLRLLAAAVPEHAWALAAVPQPADLGRVRGVDLRHGVAAVLVRRPDPRSGDAARPRQEQVAGAALRHARARLARLGAALAALRDGVPAARRPLDAAGRSRCTRSSASTSRCRSIPGWHATIFPPYFVAGAIFAGFAMVLTLAIPLRGRLRPAGLHHRCATSRTWARSCSRPG